MTVFGVPSEVRDLEMRVGLTPAGVLSLTQAGHTVYVQRDAGKGAGFANQSYQKAGAKIVYSAAEIYGRSDIVAKLARPKVTEHELFRPGQAIFSFLHLAVASPDLYQALEAKEITAVAYEMIEEANGLRPVLLPASEVAGRMTPLIAGDLLRSDKASDEQSRLGILPSGIPGVPAVVVVIIGGGVLGSNAARAFSGLGAEVTVLDKDVQALQRIEESFQSRVKTMFANHHNLNRVVQFADVLVGAISTPGQRASILITNDMVKNMRPGSIIIDCAIDEGGCVETSRPTTLHSPDYVVHGVIHHSVPNMTAAYARTTSYAITNAALPYLLWAGENGVLEAAKRHPSLAAGMNLYQGKLTDPDLAAALGRDLSFKI